MGLSATTVTLMLSPSLSKCIGQFEFKPKEAQMQKLRNNRANLMNRRQMLRLMGVTGVGLAMAGCLPPPSATQSGDAGQAAASTMDLSKWRLGSVDPNWEGTFKALSWEDEGEMRKWNYHIDNFFKANYPKAKTEINWGVPWGEYWTKLPTAITGGDPPDLAWMHDTRVQAFASRDLFLPLDDYIAANNLIDWPDAFYKTQVDAFKYDGKQYAIPYDWAPAQPPELLADGQGSYRAHPRGPRVLCDAEGRLARGPRQEGALPPAPRLRNEARGTLSPRGCTRRRRRHRARSARRIRPGLHAGV